MKTNKTTLSLIMLLLVASVSFGQNLKPLAREVQKAHQQRTSFTKIDDLLTTHHDNNLSELVSKDVRDAQLFNYDKSIADQIITEHYQALTFDITIENHLKTIEVVAVNETFNNYTLSTSSGIIPELDSRGVHYRGIVIGEENSSIVAISIFKDELIGLISIQNKGNFNLGKLSSHNYHVLYNDSNLEQVMPFSCLSDELKSHDTSSSINFQAKNNSPDDFCINVYLELDYGIYQNRGNSITNSEIFATGLFNQTAAIYQNEIVSLQISEIFVWDIPDSYNIDTTLVALEQFRDDRPNFNGDLAHLIQYKSGGGGGIAYVDQLCGIAPYGVNVLDTDYSILPTYSREVSVLTHEIGHNLGSRHTHACAWNGNNTTIDDYGNVFPSGSPIPDADGELCVDLNNPKLNIVPTLMSYYDVYHATSYSLSNGLGTQPGDLIRSEILSATCISLCNPFDCATTISSFPYSESFESSFGDWEQDTGDDFDWERNANGTQSYTTGPSSAADGSFYAYVEASNPNNPNKTTILKSPCFDLSGQNGINISFAYHMDGSGIGTLELEVSDDGGSTWTSLWSRSGEQSNDWLAANVDLSPYSGSIIQLRYVGTTTSSFAGDIAIDDIILFEEAACNASTTISSFPYSESFESSFGAWEQDTGDDFDWVRDANGTPSYLTGPSSAADGSFYAYVEASGSNNPNKTTILESPCFDFSGENGINLSFAYHMYGIFMGTLELEISINGGLSWFTLWSESGNQGNQWLTANVDLGDYAGSTIQLRFSGTTSIGVQSDMAIDDITVTTSLFGSSNSPITENTVVPIDSDVLLYPNPADDYVMVDSREIASDVINIRILNMLGKEVFNTQLNDDDNGLFRVLTDQFAPGTYMIVLRTNSGESINKRLIVQ
ncbi:MAG: M12 family metallo-peptidase [Crocinitomicaceae bacterium]